MRFDFEYFATNAADRAIASPAPDQWIQSIRADFIEFR